MLILCKEEGESPLFWILPSQQFFNTYCLESTKTKLYLSTEFLKYKYRILPQVFLFLLHISQEIMHVFDMLYVEPFHHLMFHLFLLQQQPNHILHLCNLKTAYSRAVITVKKRLFRAFSAQSAENPLKGLFSTVLLTALNFKSCLFLLFKQKQWESVLIKQL